ncbi:DUF1292 domain-containing protein [Christensenellaceae bacterium OttesenSCG-928-L17]|nr:DUF1292 domain-containing protein [Christensenellaceae bacterium OttesenSCG-928-L17]
MEHSDLQEKMLPGQEEVVLLDESGNEVRFDHLMTFFHEGEKYLALLPIDPVENVEEDEVVLLHIVTKEDEDVYETIESEVLLEEVFETFTELFEEILDKED